MAVILLAGALLHLCYRGIPLLGFPHEIRFGEAITLDNSARALADTGLYQPISEAPYVVDSDGPLFPLIVSAFPSPQGSPYLGPRVLSLFSIIFSALMLAMIIRRRAGDAAALICAALLLTLYEFFQYSYLAAADAPVLAVALTGFYLAEENRNSSRITAVIAFILAAFTRPEAVVLAVAAYLRLFFIEGRSALRWAVAYLGGGSLLLALAHLFTDGGFSEHLGAYLGVPFNQDIWVKNLVGMGLFPHRLPLVVATLLALMPSSGDRLVSIWRWLPLAAMALISWVVFGYWSAQMGLEASAYPWLLTLLAVVAVAGLSALLGIGAPKGVGWYRVSGALILLALGASLSLGRIGADVCSTYFETGVLTLIVIGEGFVTRSRWKPPLLAGLLLLQGLISLFLIADLGEFSSERVSEMEYRTALMESMESLDGPVLAEEPSIATGAGVALMIDPYLIRQLKARGGWDASGLLEEIEEAKYAAIVRAQSRILAGYEKDEQGRPLRNPDGTLRPFFGPWTSNAIRSFPPEVQDAINGRYRRLEGASTRERVTPIFLYGIEVWVPREEEDEKKR